MTRPSLFWRTTSVFVMLSQLLLCDSAMAQVSTPSIVSVTSSPSGQSCSANVPLKLFVPSGVLFSCQSGTYGLVGGGGGGDTITSPNSTLSVGGTATATTLDLNLAHSNIWTANGALSAPAVLYNGTPVTTGGTGTTTWPFVLLQPNGTTSAAWITSGTMFGVNAASGFSGNLFDFQANGTDELALTAAGSLSGRTFKARLYQTFSVCASGASPAVCAAANAGSVAVPAGTNPTLVVDTTAVTGTSQIMLTPDQSLGTVLSVTCNTTIPTNQSVTLRTAGTSFTFEAVGTFTTNPVCYSYMIIN
jgi:hypothetical protein